MNIGKALTSHGEGFSLSKKEIERKYIASERHR